MAVDTLAEVGAVRMKRGSEARVTVALGDVVESGPMVQVTNWTTAEAYESVEKIEPAWLKSRKRSKVGAPARVEYVGPHKWGLWLSPEAAEELLTVLADAVVKALELRESMGVSA